MKNLKRKLTLAALLPAALFCAGSVRAQNYVNQPVDVSEYYPSLSTFGFDTGSKTIAPGGTDFGNVDGIDVLVGPTTITFTNNFGIPLSRTPSAFNGYGIAETAPTIPSIVGVTLNSATTLPGFTASRLSFDPASVFANFQSLTFRNGDKVVLDVTFGPSIKNPDVAPVPEASTTASLGLLLTLCGVGLMVARRRSRRSI